MMDFEKLTTDQLYSQLFKVNEKVGMAASCNSYNSLQQLLLMRDALQEEISIRQLSAAMNGAPPKQSINLTSDPLSDKEAQEEKDARKPSRT